MNHREFIDLIPAYCLGALDREEKRRLEDHLESGCDECRAALETMAGIPDSLAAAVEPEAPPPQLKDRIFAALDPDAAAAPYPAAPGQKEPAAQTAVRYMKRWRFAAVSLGLAAVLLAIILLRTSADWRAERRELTSQVTISSQLIRELQSQLDNQERILQIMRSPQLRLADLRGLEPSPNATGKVVWDPQAHQAVFYGSALAPIPADRDYQLWMLRGSQPVSAAVFSPDEAGTSAAEFQTIADEENLSAFAITLEPKGGVAQPTGEMYLIGTL